MKKDNFVKGNKDFDNEQLQTLHTGALMLTKFTKGKSLPFLSVLQLFVDLHASVRERQ